ncbi:Bacterial Ig-like domain (group 2) [uncultured Eubacterium sp.]|uniref:Ig-like domain-containing protein n=1 Tax=Anaerobutyricum soehngenii TaxID=105843 RepID=A0ABS3ZN30_9FIRM|nr:DUF6273 domain-containing protein [Anaerobutyricum soehngenii]MBP0057983.1 Ig-like domain-containing protein [Anaerobutyricum soehngenii]SCI77976.1 Bacterial Ig-like domain (group 2) [uncultured Eubacterium sp.]
MERKYRKVSRWKEILVVVLSFGMIIGGVFWGTARVEAAEKISNPRIVKNSLMVAKQKVTWDCIYFGRYPQSEVVEQGSKQEALLKKMNESAEIKYEAVSSSNFQAISNASYNENGDATVNGVKYRRLRGMDATYVETLEVESHYKYDRDYTTYHYFKYEPIKWRVLNVQNGKAFLLADIVLDNQKYNMNEKKCFWSDSSMRSWLNGYEKAENQSGIDYTSKNFIGSAFSMTEQKAIKVTHVVNKGGVNYGTMIGDKDTEDKIFLLSELEACTTAANKYGFATEERCEDEARRCSCSTYAYAMGAWRGGDGGNYVNSIKRGRVYWWLRASVSLDGESPDFIESGGRVHSLGGGYNSTGGMRPALYMNLADSNNYTYAGTVCSVQESSRINEENADIDQEGTVKRVKSLSFLGNLQKIAAGCKVSLKVNIIPKEVSDVKLIWKSSNSKVATVTQNGVVTLKKKTGGKKVIITAMATDGSGVSSSWEITSMSGIVKKIKIAGAKQVKAGKKLKLKAKVSATKKANTKLLWTSSNPKLATVNAKGVVKTKKSAKRKTVKITAMATDGSNKKTTVKIKIK